MFNLRAAPSSHRPHEASSSRPAPMYARQGVRGRPTQRGGARCDALPGGKWDIVLSSGFLAFANHSGLLQAVEQNRIKVGGIMGTSAGALAGSLYAAGYSPKAVAQELSRVPPAQLLRLSPTPWAGGVLSLSAVVDRLSELLPPTFEELRSTSGIEFAVGVVTADGRHHLINRGPLPQAVAASAAIPIIFQHVDVPGFELYGPFKDGGCVDRVGLKVWRNWRRARLGPGRPPPPCLVHVIGRSSPFSGADDVLTSREPNVVLVKSPKSRASFFDLGDFEQQMAAAQARAQRALDEADRQGIASAAGSTGRMDSPVSMARAGAGQAPGGRGAPWSPLLRRSAGGAAAADAPSAEPTVLISAGGSDSQPSVKRALASVGARIGSK